MSKKQNVKIKNEMKMTKCQKYPTSLPSPNTVGPLNSSLNPAGQTCGFCHFS